MTFLLISGGAALTIFGVRFLRKGLDRLFGGKLVAWLARMTQRRWKAFGSGVVVGTLAPSSTALSLITLQMLNTGKLTSERMLAVLLGANVGITVTVQLLAFHVQDFAAIFILLGVIGFQFLNREIPRGIGQCLLSLGFIFLAMQMIGQGASALTESPESAQWIALFENHPLLTFLFATAFTFCVQSSTASIGFAIALGLSGLLSPLLIIPWVLGANLGIAVTSLVAGWSTLEGKRLAVANLGGKLVIALPILFIPLVSEKLFGALPGSEARQIATFHTGFNLLVGLLAMPLLGPITRLVRVLITPPEVRADLPQITSYLDPQSLDTPSLALANATRETLQMADGTKQMLLHFWKAHLDRDVNLILRVQQEDDRVDQLYRDIKSYLSRIGEGITEEEVRWQFTLLTFSNELESIGDLIDKNLCEALRRLTAEGTQLNPEDAAALAALYEKVMARFEMAVGLLTHHGGSQLKAFLAGKESFNEWCRETQIAHYARLKVSDSTGLAASAYFLELLNNLRRINSGLTTIGYALSPVGRKRPRPPIQAGESA